MKMKITLLLAIMFAASQGFSQYYVSVNGSDSNPGTLALPFKTIQKAADVIAFGETCYIMAGTYHETVTPLNNGTSGAPIMFKNYQNDKVIIVGTDSITGWVPYQNGIYKAYAPDTVLQLSVDKKMAYEARYPNFRGNYMSTSDWKAVTIDTNSNATFPGTNFPTGYWVGGYVEALVASKWVCHNGLISTSSGSSVHCSQTSYPWGTHPAYSPSIYTGSGKGYITHHLNALDTVNEWHWQNDTLYYYPQNPSTINTTSCQARTRMYGFNCYGKQYIQINNIHFVWATVNFETATGCVLDGGSVWFPSPFHFYLRGWDRQANDGNNYGISQWRGKGVAMSGYNNNVKNCYIAHSWGDGVSIGGQNNTVENCLIEDCDWAATDYALITTAGSGHKITHNTIRNTARSAIVHRKSNATHLTYNDMYDCGFITQDLGITYTFMSNGGGSHISYNWAHDNHAANHAMGIYLDNADTLFNVHHNVIWNCINAIQTNKTAKDHQIYNNTVWACTNAMATYGAAGTLIINQQVKNNLSNKPWSIGTTFSNNLVSANPQFTDAANYDFTLSASSPAIDYGVAIPGFTDGFAGAAPDAGAYEYGVQQWIPGATTLMPDISEVYTDPSLPAQAKFISGPSNVCQGQTSVVYTVEPIINALSYIWTLPNGATGTSNTNKIVVDYSTTATTGNITVKGHNANGDGLTAVRVINVYPVPATPTITVNGSSLHSDATSGNQWYNQSGIINGATGQDYTVLTNGDYYVIVTQNGCSSAQSNTINVTDAGLEQNELNSPYKIYPNPVTNELIIEMAGNNENKEFEILNSFGQSIYNGLLKDKVIVNTNDLAAGLYIVKLETGNTFKLKKVVKE